MNFLKYFFPTTIINNIKIYSLLLCTLVCLSFSSYILYLNATFNPTIYYVVTDRIELMDGECTFRSVWSTGLKRSDRSDVFGCKERETQLGEKVFITCKTIIDYKVYGGILPWYIGPFIVIIFVIIAIVSTALFFVIINEDEIHVF